MVFEIRSSTKIEAPIDEVWEHLLDLESWKEWNRWFLLEDCKPEPGAQGTVAVSVNADGKYSRLAIKFLDVSKEKYLMRWRGDAGCGGFLFKGEHSMQLVPQDDGSVLFIHNEDLSGLLVKFELGFPYHEMHDIYPRVNESFKDYVLKVRTNEVVNN